jgi:ABC-type multidrug transport system ATPase subunit
MAHTPSLEITHLTKRYRGGTLANDDLSLAVEPGQVYGLLGPNGAGKTTLVRQVLGLLRPTSGSIRVTGVDVVADPGHARRTIGFLPQAQFNFESVRIGEFIQSIGRLRGLDAAEARRQTDALIDRLDLGAFRKTTMVQASGGVKRLAGFAAAVIGDSRLLVLDEPTNDVDPVRRMQFWQMLRDLGDQGTTILLVTHNLAEADRALDRLAIIDGGRIVREGSPAGLRAALSSRLRLDLTAREELAPHPALIADPAGRGRFHFEEAHLSAVTGWLTELRRLGIILDYRIGPPSLDDIYVASLAAPELEPVA